MKINATPELIAPLFPGAPIANIREHLPRVIGALEAAGLDDKPMLLMALGTIRAETGSFKPLSEGISQWNTLPGGVPFAMYDYRRDLGNQGPPDGATFKGRGFVQLTGRANYDRHGRDIGVDLIANPELANDPDTAAHLLASYLKSHEPQIRAALANNDMRAARRAVNGGLHGLDVFTDTFTRGNELIQETAA